MEIRTLAGGDEERLEAFLERHLSSSLFLLSNLRAAGIQDRGQPFEGPYAAAFSVGRIRGVVAHYWNGNLVLQAPDAAAEVARHAALHSGRDIRGLIDPCDQVEHVRSDLGLAGVATHLDTCEDLFALQLDEMKVPETLVKGEVRCRAPYSDELQILHRWKHDFSVEALHEPASDASVAVPRGGRPRSRGERVSSSRSRAVVSSPCAPSQRACRNAYSWVASGRRPRIEAAATRGRSWRSLCCQHSARG